MTKQQSVNYLVINTLDLYRVVQMTRCASGDVDRSGNSSIRCFVATWRAKEGHAELPLLLLCLP